MLKCIFGIDFLAFCKVIPYFPTNGIIPNVEDKDLIDLCYKRFIYSLSGNAERIYLYGFFLLFNEDPLLILKRNMELRKEEIRFAHHFNQLEIKKTLVRHENSQSHSDLDKWNSLSPWLS
ncbi:hypothetical protein NE237_033314 [Protea cynaroides]|uniref:Uncharacterized protein n=1 Tax=Protea cynaroides TaxID=273540 RepID=A0A9Q0L4V9_9MAGN|nr:hypothetical protein NE237_033314 [Protea cynaroides]